LKISDNYENDKKIISFFSSDNNDEENVTQQIPVKPDNCNSEDDDDILYIYITNNEERDVPLLLTSPSLEMGRRSLHILLQNIHKLPVPTPTYNPHNPDIDGPKQYRNMLDDGVNNDDNDNDNDGGGDNDENAKSLRKKRRKVS
jgi:hypothetical protein